MVNDNGKLSARQLAYITELMQSPSKAAAAAACNVPPSTYKRWFTLPEFNAAVEAAKRQTFESALQTVRAGAKKAAEKLLELIDCKDKTVQRLAADSILRHAFKSWELLELEDRLSRLEAALQGEPGQRREGFFSADLIPSKRGGDR